MYFVFLTYWYGVCWWAVGKCISDKRSASGNIRVQSTCTECIEICIQFMVYQDPILSSPNPIFFCLVFRQPATIKNFNLLFFSLKKKITENTSTWIWKLECTQSFDWIVKVKVHLPSLKAYCWICNAVIGSAHFLSFPSFSKITWIWSTNNNVWIHRCILDAAGVLFRLYLLRLIVGSPFSPPYSRPSLFPKVAFTTGSAQNIRRLTQRRWLLPRLFCSHWRIQWG